MDNQNNKCNKYESLFVFQNEKIFNEHIMKCQDCRREHEKYLKISSLVKEVAPLYLEKEKHRKMMAATRNLACCLIAFIGLSVFTGYKIYDNYNYQSDMEQESYVGEMGLPIDEYGFLSL